MARRVNEAGAALKTVGHLFWLQRRLLLNGLLRGDARSRGRLLLTGLILLGTLPYLAVGTVGLYIALRSVDPGTAERILAVGMGALLMFWAMAPLTGQPLLENVGYLRLLHQPLSLLSLALGGQFSGLFSLLGVTRTVGRCPGHGSRSYPDHGRPPDNGAGRVDHADPESSIHLAGRPGQ